MRGVSTWWIAFTLSMFGTLFPDLAAHGFLDDRRLVRWIAVPMLFASTIMLVSYYTRWF